MMRKSTILLSLALVLVLSMSTFAALSTDIKGFVEMDLTYAKADGTDPDSDYVLKSRARGQATLSMSSGSSGNPKVTITMSGGETPDKDTWIDFENALEKDQKGMPFKITGMKLEATGALWKDGPELKTVIGTHTANWNKYTAWQLGRNSIEVSGLSVGPIAVRGIYSYTNASSGYNKVAGYTGALHASGNLDIVSLNAYVTNFGASQTDSDNRYTNFTVDATANPAAGLSLSGVFSYDAEHEASAYKAEAKLTTIPNLTLTGLIRVAEEDYDPAHTDKRKDHRVWWEDEKVYRVGASTEQAGVKLDGSFQLENKFSDEDYRKTIVEGSASTTIEGFAVGATVTLTNEKDATEETNTTKTVLDAKTTLPTAFADVTLTYKGTIETDREMRNELGASTKVDLFFADGVAIDAKVIFDKNADRPKTEPEELSYGIDFKWTPPLGIDLTVGYANYNKSGKDWVHPDVEEAADGFYIRAHKRISF